MLNLIEDTKIANIGDTARRAYRLGLIVNLTRPILARLAAQSGLAATPAPILDAYGLTAQDFVIEPTKTDAQAFALPPASDLVLRPIEPVFYEDFAMEWELGAVALTVHLETAALTLREVAECELAETLQNEVAVAVGVTWLARCPA